MFVYFYLTAQVIEEKMRMWEAGEEISEYLFHFDGIQKRNRVELETIKQKRVIKMVFHNLLSINKNGKINSIFREEQRNKNLEKRSPTLDLSAHHFEDIGMN